MDLTQPLNDLKSGQTVVFWDKSERYGSINPKGGITIWHADGGQYEGGQDYSVLKACKHLRQALSDADFPTVVSVDSCLSYLGPITSGMRRRAAKYGIAY